MSGHFNLSFDQFEISASDAFKELATDEHFTDVTLACADDKQIKAHRVILSSFSPILRTILLKVKQQNPVIYLRGIKEEDLRSVINFMYLGETIVRQESFPDFMQIAQEMKIKGLAVNIEEEKKLMEVLPSTQNTNVDHVNDCDEMEQSVMPICDTPARKLIKNENLDIQEPSLDMTSSTVQHCNERNFQV